MKVLYDIEYPKGNIFYVGITFCLEIQEQSNCQKDFVISQWKKKCSADSTYVWQKAQKEVSIAFKFIVKHFRSKFQNIYHSIFYANFKCVIWGGTDMLLT